MLALLPFEPPYMTAAGMGCSFVGHPVVSEPQATKAEALAFRSAHGIAPDQPLILALPGSRQGEVARLAPRFGATLALVAAHHPTLRVVVPTLATLRPQVAAAIADWPGNPVLLSAPDQATKAAAFAAATAALAASGTVSLELAASATPMVIGYDMAWLSRQIIGRLMRVDSVTLVNLVSDTRAIPEFLGAACQPDTMAAALIALFSPGPARTAQLGAMAMTMDRLGRGGEDPGLRAARAVLANLAAR